MTRNMLKSKIHRATVTDANLNYEGSVTIDPLLLEAANMVAYERIEVLDINNGERFATYIIEGERGKGEICLNGAAARKVAVGDLVILLTYVNIEEDKVRAHRPIAVHVDQHNHISRIEGEIHPGLYEVA